MQIFEAADGGAWNLPLPQSGNQMVFTLFKEGSCQRLRVELSEIKKLPSGFQSKKFLRYLLNTLFWLAQFTSAFFRLETIAGGRFPRGSPAILVLV